MTSTPEDRKKVPNYLLIQIFRTHTKTPQLRLLKPKYNLRNFESCCSKRSLDPGPSRFGERPYRRFYSKNVLRSDRTDCGDDGRMPVVGVTPAAIHNRCSPEFE